MTIKTTWGSLQWLLHCSIAWGHLHRDQINDDSDSCTACSTAWGEPNRDQPDGTGRGQHEQTIARQSIPPDSLWRNRSLSIGLLRTKFGNRSTFDDTGPLVLTKKSKNNSCKLKPRGGARRVKECKLPVSCILCKCSLLVARVTAAVWLTDWHRDKNNNKLNWFDLDIILGSHHTVSRYAKGKLK